MNNEKITGAMGISDMIFAMCNGNLGAMNIMMQMMNDPDGIMDILLCDTLNIRGSKLYMLYNDCCRRNYAKFKRTLMMLRCGIFSKEEIDANLGLVRAIPFIDDSIVIEGVPPYGEEFGPESEKWEEFCQRNKEAFAVKINPVLERQDKPKTRGPKL